MIANNDRVGDYFVAIIASKKFVRSFQCPSLEDAKEEAQKIWYERNKKGLQTRRMFARQIVGNNRGLQLSEVEYEL